MIHAGTISTGSGRTSSVAGAYWISSISRLRIDHLAGREADVLADFEGVGANRLASVKGALPVLDEVPEAAHQVMPGLRFRLLQHLRIGEHEVRRRKDVQDLPRGEFDLALVLRGDAAHAGRGIVPPLLLQQERLVDGVVGPGLPRFGAEALVMGRGSMQDRPGPLGAARKWRVVPEPAASCGAPSARAAAACPALPPDARASRNRPPRAAAGDRPERQRGRARS